MEPKKYWQIRNASEKSAEILIYQEIGYDWWDDTGIDAEMFVEDLKALGDVQHLDVRIKSPGGSVFEGWGIYNALKRHPATVTTYNDAVVASIASVIYMAGDRRVTPENGMFIIHEASGVAMGTAAVMRKMADQLDVISDGILDEYDSNTTLERDTIKDMMAEDTWFRGKDAVEWGFATELTEPVQMAACTAIPWERYGYKNVPQEWQPKPGETPRLNSYANRFAAIKKAQRRVRLVQEIHDIRARREGKKAPAA